MGFGCDVRKEEDVTQLVDKVKFISNQRDYSFFLVVRLKMRLDQLSVLFIILEQILVMFQSWTQPQGFTPR